MSEALASGNTPQFSADYEATIATIRTQALGALPEAKGFLEHLEPELKNQLGGDVLPRVNVEISAISDGNDIVFIVDSRSAEVQAALAGIEHFDEQIAIRKRGFRDESGQSTLL